MKICPKCGRPKISWQIIQGDSRHLSKILKQKGLAGITSPPFLSGNPNENYTFLEKKIHSQTGKPDISYPSRERYLKNWFSEKNIGNLPDNNLIGNQAGESYLSAMFQVYKEAFKSGISPLILVTKNPTRKGKLRRLDLDTISLLQAVGYQIIDYHRSVLFKVNKQSTFNNGIKKNVKGRISFFKRLSYNRGSPVASWEDVIFCAIK